MTIRKKAQKRKSINRFITLLIFFVIFSSISFLSVSGAEIGDIEITTRVGFNNFYEYDNQVPIKVKLENNLKDIDGKLQILFPHDYRGKEVYIAYSKDFSIAKDSTKEVEFSSFITNDIKEIVVRIIDKNDKIIMEKEVMVPRGKPSNDISIGVLSDDFESLNYFNLLFISESQELVNQVNTKMFKLNDNMVENWEVLKNFDIIIINNYNTETFSKLENEALEEWVKNGGFLLIGTGSNYEKTLKGLGDLSYIEVTDLAKIQEINESIIGSLTVINSTVESGNQLLIENDITIVYNKEAGLGNIMITAFDLGLNPFLKWEGKVNFLRNILDPYVSISKELDIKFGISRSGYYRGNSYSNIVEYIPMDKAAPLKLILWLVAIFILLVGPINYIVLKKLDKRELAWITIPSIVVIFSLFIYIWGFTVRHDKPLSNNVSTIRIIPQSSKAVVNTTAGVIAFSNGDTDISIDGDASFFIDQFDPEEESYKFRDGDIILEYLQNDNSHVIYKKQTVWSSQFINVNDDIDVGEGIDHDLRIVNGKIVGEINNKTGLDLEDVVFMCNNDYVKLGSIDVNESKSVNLTLNTAINTNRSYYSIINKIYPYGNADLDFTNILNDNVKRDVLFRYFDWMHADSYTGSSSNILLIGWNREKLSDDIVVNNINTERMDRNLIIAPMSINFSKGERVEVPHGIFTPKVLKLDNVYHEYGDSVFHGNGSVTFSMKPDVDMELEEMEIDITKGLIVSDFEIFVFNYETNEWEGYTEGILTINRNDTAYYNDRQGTKIKVDLNDKASLFYPSFSVKGVVK